MTRLYLLDLTALAGAQWQKLIPLLPPERQSRVKACRFEEDKLRVAGAGWLLRCALEREGIPFDAQCFAENPWGKPGLDGKPDLHFNLSHSGTWAVCAVSDRPVGVDVEAKPCSMELAKKQFLPRELEQLPEDGLIRLWTAKEAFSKAIGRGLTVRLDSFEVCLHADGAELRQDLSPLPYRLHEYKLGDVRLSLCCTDERPEPEYMKGTCACGGGPV